MNQQLEIPGHISHSSRETLERCARSYFLGRVAKAPKRPALWLAGGSAVHETTEDYDLLALAGGLDDFDVSEAWNVHFDAQLAEARAAEPNEYKWARSQAEPIEVWRTNGLGFVRSYIDWRERSPWEIWMTPEGYPAIELDVSGMLPGCPVEIKAYLDRVFWDPVLERRVILDLKSGKRPPKTASQFETYAALLKVKHDVQTDLGVPFMNRKGTLGKPYELAEVTPEGVGEVYGKAWEQIQEYARTGSWPANGLDKECFICDTSASCYAKGGPLSAQYDPADPAYPPPY